MDTPDFRTHKEGWMLLAGFDAGLQSDSDAVKAVIPGRAKSANPESRGYRINNLGIPDPALCAGPE
jgi:hypothetical protein